MLELPEEMCYVWEYFIRLNKKRTSSGFGVNPLTYSDMESFFRLNEIQVSPDEIQLIEILDDLMLEHYAKESEKENKKKKIAK